MAVPATSEIVVGETSRESRFTDRSTFLLVGGDDFQCSQSVQLGSILPAGGQPGTPPMLLGNSSLLRASRIEAGRQEDISYRGVNLVLACVKGDLPLVAMLLAEGTEQGLDMLAADNEGNTPLHYAALSDSPDVITFLLGKANGGSGISYGSGRCTSRRRSNGLLDLRNDAWETPLLRSAVGGSVPVAKALLDAGADISATDSSKNTVFHNAARNGRLWLLAFFLSAAVAGGESGDTGNTGVASSGKNSCDTKPNNNDGDILCITPDTNAIISGLTPSSIQQRSSKSPVSSAGATTTTTTTTTAAVSISKKASVSSILRRVDCDRHTALDWACYSGNLGAAKLLIANGLDPRAVDDGGKNCLHWAASQGQAETCRYLVLIGMDPRLLDFNGNDAFKLSKGCPGVAPALSLATAVKRNLDNADRLWSSTARCAGGSRTEVVATKASSGGKIVGEERRDDGGVKHGGGVGIGRAPTAGAGIEVEIEAGKVTEQGEQGEGDLKCAGGVAVPPERRNPARAWVIAAFAVPVCGIWSLSFVVPWWGWVLLVTLGSAGLKRAEGVAANIVKRGSRGRRSEAVVGPGREDGLGDLETAIRPQLPPLLALALAPEKYLALWAGVALCFVSLSTSIATRIFTATDLLRVDISSIQNDDDQREGFVLDSNSEIAKVYFREVWAFAGASIGADRGEGVGNDAINPAPASTAWVSVGLIIITLCLWSTLIAGNGRRAASQAAAAATLMDTRRTGGAMMGCGDPGAVRIQPREDMRTLVEGVGKALGPPNARDICVTCLVRKPLRSKHCAKCGFCVGRMDHHCVWLNNCVGYGNHRVFFAFVLCQLAYGFSFLCIATTSFVVELPLEGSTWDIVRTLLSKEYFPAFLLLLTAAGGVIMLTGIFVDQVLGILTNTTSNERINRKRYPWLNASPCGPPFNRYNRGPWGNFLEFMRVGQVEDRGIVEGEGIHRRRRHDYLQGYELPLLDLQQEAKLASLLKKNADDAMQRSTVHSSVCNEGYCVEAIGNGIHSRVQNGGDCEEKTANSDRRGSCGTLGTDS